MNIADEIQKLKVGAAAAALLLVAGALLIGALHFGALIASALFAALTVGAALGAGLMRFIE